MRAEKLLDEIGKIDDKFIEEANSRTIRFKNTKYATLLKYASCAAVFLILIGIAFANKFIYTKSNDFSGKSENLAVKENEKISDSPPLIGSDDSNDSSNPTGSSDAKKEDIDDKSTDSDNKESVNLSGLPMLEVNDNFYGGFGFEGYMAYNIDELKNGNPWSEDYGIKELPVFKNTVKYDPAGLVIDGGLSDEDMIQKAKDLAVIMDLGTEITTKKGENEVLLSYSDIAVEVEKNGSIRIKFLNEGLQLPEEYNFTFSDTSEQEAKEVMQYLIEEYKSVINLETPVLGLFGDYDIYGKRSFDYKVYESSGSIVDKILGYSFNSVRFSPNYNGRLSSINIYVTDLSQKIGDYPIITSEKAKELLLQNKYISSCPYELPGEEYIAKVELVYRNSIHDETLMPYYRFLVELTEQERANGLKDFGAYYVPAVEEKYISNMPLWDGSFN